MDLKGAKVLVAGGAGFIGSHVVDLLTKEDVDEIIVYDNFTRGTVDNLEYALKDERVRIFDVGGDITQEDILDSAVKEVDAVVHLAALWLLHCQDYPKSAFEVNIRGTFNVIEACIRNNIKRLVYSSSASVYGDALEIPMTEDHPFNNKTFYGATKIIGEQMARAFHHRYGLNYVGLRYMNVYGARQDYMGTYIAVIMKILDRLDKGLSPIIYGDGSQSYDFIYVEDAALSNIRALKSDVVDSFYNVGVGIGTSIKELTELILKVTGHDVEIQYEPEGQTFVTNRIGSTDRAEKDLGFVATVGLEEGISRLIEWRNSHKELIEKRAKKAEGSR